MVAAEPAGRLMSITGGSGDIGVDAASAFIKV
jgi:hypothetical protein